MLKALFTKERIDGFGVAFIFEFVNIMITHSYCSEWFKQPTVSVVLRLLKWNFYLMIYREVNQALHPHCKS